MWHEVVEGKVATGLDEGLELAGAQVLVAMRLAVDGVATPVAGVRQGTVLRDVLFRAVAERHARDLALAPEAKRPPDRVDSVRAAGQFGLDLRRRDESFHVVALRQGLQVALQERARLLHNCRVADAQVLDRLGSLHMQLQAVLVAVLFDGRVLHCPPAAPGLQQARGFESPTWCIARRRLTFAHTPRACDLRSDNPEHW
mmetsp:Transcript_75401/g.208050  ORF Transcript_75401/g.208050 Transcript_75401/m.208050 type:complete len:200 (-) Transcript_75401:109-708(-)